MKSYKVKDDIYIFTNTRNICFKDFWNYACIKIILYFL